MPESKTTQATPEPDAAQIASENAAREKGMRTITDEDAALALIGGGAQSDAPEPDEDSSSRRDVDEQFARTATQSRTAADSESDADEGSLSDDQDADTQLDETTEDVDDTQAQQAQSQSQSQSQQFNDLFIGLDDDGNLAFQASEAVQSAPDVTTQSSTAPLSDADRIRMWQSKADQAEARVAKLESRIAELEAQSQSSQQQQPQPGNVHRPADPFTKSPEDYMHNGEEFDVDDAADPRTASGKAYQAWLRDKDAHTRESIKSEILNDIRSEEAQRIARQRWEAQVTYIRSKRPEMSDTEIEQLTKWAQQVGQTERGLFILSMARDLANGRFKLTGDALRKLNALTQTGAANGTGTGNGKRPAPSVTTQPAAQPQPARRVDSDTKVLSSHFADFGQLSI